MCLPTRRFINRVAVSLLSVLVLSQWNLVAAQSREKTESRSLSKDSFATTGGEQTQTVEQKGPSASTATAGELAPVLDPWERYNRSMYRFNAAADKYVVRPLAVAYDTVTPPPVQRSVTNFFANLESPRVLVNQLLQGHAADAAKTFGRFATNSTIGVGGLFDPASSMDLPHRDEDFGQTFAAWGWGDSRYLVLPFVGPSTVRDLAGSVGDTPMSPIGYIDNGTAVAALGTLQVANERTQLFPLDAVRAGAIDEYTLVRDMWMQMRNRKIQENMESQKD